MATTERVNPIELHGEMPFWPFKTGVWPKLSARAKAVYPVFVYHAGFETGKSWASLRTIGKEVGLSHVTVRRAVEELTAHRLILFERGHQKRANRYVICKFPPKKRELCPAEERTKEKNMVTPELTRCKPQGLTYYGNPEVNRTSTINEHQQQAPEVAAVARAGEGESILAWWESRGPDYTGNLNDAKRLAGIMSLTQLKTTLADRDDWGWIQNLGKLAEKLEEQRKLKASIEAGQRKAAEELAAKNARDRAEAAPPEVAKERAAELVLKIADSPRPVTKRGSINRPTKIITCQSLAAERRERVPGLNLQTKQAAKKQAADVLKTEAVRQKLLRRFEQRQVV